MLGDRRRPDRSAGAAAPPQAARTTTRTAGSGGRGSSPAARCRARSSRSSSSSRSRCRRSTSTSASRTTARCPTSTEARRAYDGMTAAFGVGANGPLLVSVDMSEQAGEGRPVEARRPRRSRSPTRRSRRSRRRTPRSSAAGGAGRAAGPGAGAGPAAARQADQGDLGEGRRRSGRRLEQHGDRPAPAGPAHDIEKAAGVGEGDPAARQQGGHRGGADRHADDRAVGPGDRASSSARCATTRSRRRPRART